jgi:hydroxymethylpyrimidine/phosphomethylpyrimidine kinase
VPSKTVVKILVIAGLDPSGGAGIFLDIKTIQRLGGYAFGIPTCLTVQNTQKVYKVYEINPRYFLKTFEVLIKDVGELDSVKIGVLYSKKIIDSTIELIKKYQLKNIVLDPVINPTKGVLLLKKDAFSSFLRLISLCTVITPNIPEAEILSGKRIKSLEDMETSIEEISKKFEIENIVLKGGHLNIENKVYDLLYSRNRFVLFEKEYLKDQNIHGTGCLFSSILSFFLAQNLNIEKAFYETQNFFQKIIKKTIKIGKGQDLVNF